MKTANINGVTLKELNRIINSFERVINWYNKKYKFDIAKATQKEQKEYYSNINVWDTLKVKRDYLKSL